ncbi:MAG: cell division protein ZapA [Bacteroidetes bacterium]|nr:cell division protein ZapA [Bacteroidota bacterium]
MTEATTIEVVQIADLDFKISISNSERESLTTAVSEINQRIKAYKKQYDIHDRTQLLAMTLIKLATDFEVFRAEANKSKSESLTHQQALLTKLNDYLNNQTRSLKVSSNQ